jgi:hypothetical protein
MDVVTTSTKAAASASGDDQDDGSCKEAVIPARVSFDAIMKMPLPPPPSTVSISSGRSSSAATRDYLCDCSSEEPFDHLAEQRRRRYSSFYPVRRGSRGDILGVSIDVSDFINMVDDMDLTWYRYGWTFVLGVAGISDMMAFAGPRIRTFGGCDEFLSWPSTTGFKPATSEASVFCTVWVPLIQWLETHDVEISFVFSILWAMHSFIKAKEDRHHFEVQCDRRRLLKLNHESRNGIVVDDKSREEKYLKAWFSRMKLTPHIVYYRHVLLQLTFLPVGFYVIIYNKLVQVYSDGKILGLLDEFNVTNGTETVHQVDDGKDEMVDYEIFTERSKLALLFAFVKHFYLSMMAIKSLARIALIKVIRKNAMKYIRRLLRRAIHNPIKSRRQFKNFMKYVRYTKYMIPVIGGLNKLKAQVDDLLKKYKQKMIAEKQGRVRKSLRAKNSAQLREDDAAVLIQSAYRSHRARRYRNALLLLQKDRKATAAAKIQAQLRRKLAVARVNLMQKRAELELLEHQRRLNPENLADEDRRRLYELQDEFAYEAKKIINRTILLSPNSRFAITWKVLFVLSVVFEVSQKAVAPWLYDRRARKTGKPMAMRELVANTLIPVSPSQNPHCNMKPERTTSFDRLFHRKRFVAPKDVDLGDYTSDTIPWVCYEPFSTWWGGVHDMMALALTPISVMEWPECKPFKPTTIWDRISDIFLKCNKSRRQPISWYCREPYASIQTSYRWIIDGLIDDFTVLVSIICFFDVFVTFFTGEIDQTSGMLTPKPFFKRWIFPGLLLQLLVNPSIDSVSDIVFETARSVYNIGPVRVWRWVVTVCLPIIYGCSKVINIFALQQARPNDGIVVGYRLDKLK